MQAAERLGFPVVVKVDGPAHKAIAGGVVLGVTDAAAVADATVRLGGSVLVAKQVPAGIETFCGMTRDPDYGPIVAVGLGGRAIEALSLAAVALAPIGWERARALVAEAPGLARLATPVALDQLATIAVAVSRLAVEHPEVQAIDVNPVILSDADAVAVDALIHVAPDAPRRVACRYLPPCRHHPTPAQGVRALYKPVPKRRPSVSTLASPSQSSAIRHARIDLAAAHRLAVLDGFHEGTWNHLSVSVPGAPERMLVTPSYVHWSQVTASSLVDVGPGGAVEDMDEAAWIAYRIHYPLHSARPDAVCVMHTHAPSIVAMAMIGEELNTAEQNALAFHGRVAYTSSYDGLLDDMRQGAFMAEALGDTAYVLFLRNHGAVVVGPTIGQTYTSMYLLNRACQAQILAMSTGRPLQSVPADDLRGWTHNEYGAPGEDYRWHHFEAMKRVLDATEPGYVA